MKNLREAVRDFIEQRIIPQVERNGVSKLFLPEQIRPEDCIELPRCDRPCGGHHAPELAIGLTGRATFCICQKAFVFTPGRMVLLPAETSHTSARANRRYLKNINPNRPNTILWFTVYPFSVRVQVTRVPDDEDTDETTQPYLLLGQHFATLAAWLLEEIRTRPSGYARIGRYILLEFLERCLRATAAELTVDAMDTMKTLSGKSTGGRRSGRRKPRARAKTTKTSAKKELPAPVQAAQEFIRSNYHVFSLSLDDVAEAADISAAHLIPQFKAAVGTTPMRYLLDIRIEAARELLMTDLKVSEVSGLVGIEDPAYFSRAFRKTNGISPLQFRRKLAGKTPAPRRADS